MAKTYKKRKTNKRKRKSRVLVGGWEEDEMLKQCNEEYVVNTRFYGAVADDERFKSEWIANCMDFKRDLIKKGIWRA